MSFPECSLENKTNEENTSEPLNICIMKSLPWFSATFDSSTLKIIGSGAFGVVFSVYHTNFKRLVALKVIEVEKEDLNEEIEELIKMKSLKHANILEILEHRLIFYGNEKIFFFMIMEQGLLSLNSYLSEKHNGMSEKELCETIRVLSSAISYAHQNKIVHCDIKPANIILFNIDSKNSDLEYIPKISDWGSAYEFKEFNNRLQTRRKTGMNFTSLFLAPELQFLEEEQSKIRKVNFFSGDVYALGITLLRCAGIKKEIKGLSGEVEKEFYEPKLKKILNQLEDKGLSAETIEKIRRMIVFEPNERVLSLEENKVMYLYVKIFVIMLLNKRCSLNIVNFKDQRNSGFCPEREKTKRADIYLGNQVIFICLNVHVFIDLFVLVCLNKGNWK